MNVYIGDKKGITNSSKAKPACAINRCSYLLLVGITQVHLGINHMGVRKLSRPGPPEFLRP